MFAQTSFREPALSAASQAGLVNNLNAGLTWGLLLVLFASAGLSVARIGVLAAIGDVAHPAWRARAVGVYRLWRDGGFAVGAVLAGLPADAFGTRLAIWAIAALTLASGLVIALRMYETMRPTARSGRHPGETAEDRGSDVIPPGV